VTASAAQLAVQEANQQAIEKAANALQYASDLKAVRKEKDCLTDMEARLLVLTQSLTDQDMGDRKMEATACRSSKKITTNQGSALFTSAATLLFQYTSPTRISRDSDKRSQLSSPVAHYSTANHGSPSPIEDSSALTAFLEPGGGAELILTQAETISTPLLSHKPRSPDYYDTLDYSKVHKGIDYSKIGDPGEDGLKESIAYRARMITFGQSGQHKVPSKLVGKGQIYSPLSPPLAPHLGSPNKDNNIKMDGDPGNFTTGDGIDEDIDKENGQSAIGTSPLATSCISTPILGSPPLKRSSALKPSSFAPVTHNTVPNMESTVDDDPNIIEGTDQDGAGPGPHFITMSFVKDKRKIKDQLLKALTDTLSILTDNLPNALVHCIQKGIKLPPLSSSTDATFPTSGMQARNYMHVQNAWSLMPGIQNKPKLPAPKFGKDGRPIFGKNRGYKGPN
jgi:hypothetical protein